MAHPHPDPELLRANPESLRVLEYADPGSRIQVAVAVAVAVAGLTKKFVNHLPKMS